LNKFVHPNATMTTAFEKDFKPPRSLRQCTGYVNMNGKNSPAGTVLHVMLLNDIHCNKRCVKIITLDTSC